MQYKICVIHNTCLKLHRLSLSAVSLLTLVAKSSLEYLTVIRHTTKYGACGTFLATVLTL